MDWNLMSEKVYVFWEWIMRLVMANLVWLLFTLFGGVFLGFAPATVGLFVVARKWINKDYDMSIFKTFKETFKRYFIKANSLMYTSLVFLSILLVDLNFFGNRSGVLFELLTLVTYFLIFIWITTMLYIIPLFVHFKLKLWEYYRNAFALAFSSPTQTLLMISYGVFVVILALYFPTIVVFFGGSGIALGLSWLTHNALSRYQQVEYRYEKHKT